MCSQSNNQSKKRLLVLLQEPIVKKSKMDVNSSNHLCEMSSNLHIWSWNSKSVHDKYVGAPTWTLGRLLRGMVFIKVQSLMLEWPYKSPNM